MFLYKCHHPTLSLSSLMSPWPHYSPFWVIPLLCLPTPISSILTSFLWPPQILWVKPIMWRLDGGIYIWVRTHGVFLSESESLILYNVLPVLSIFLQIYLISWFFSAVDYSSVVYFLCSWFQFYGVLSFIVDYSSMLYGSILSLLILQLVTFRLISFCS